MPVSGLVESVVLSRGGKPVCGYKVLILSYYHSRKYILMSVEFKILKAGAPQTDSILYVHASPFPKLLICKAPSSPSLYKSILLDDPHLDLLKGQTLRP